MYVFGKIKMIFYLSDVDLVAHEVSLRPALLPLDRPALLHLHRAALLLLHDAIHEAALGLEWTTK